MNLNPADSIVLSDVSDIVKEFPEFSAALHLVHNC